MPPVLLVLLDFLVSQDLEERQASQGLLESGVWQALQGEKVPQVPWDHLDHRGQWEHLVPLDSKETRETQEQGCQGPEASVVNQVSGVKMATLARKDLVDSWGPLAAGESEERRATLALQDSRVTRVTQL